MESLPTTIATVATIVCQKCGEISNKDPKMHPCFKKKNLIIII